MQVNAAPLSADGAPVDGPAPRLISIPFLLLRVSTAGGAFAMGLVQTLVFARVLTPDRFSLFILVEVCLQAAVMTTRCGSGIVIPVIV